MVTRASHSSRNSSRLALISLIAALGAAPAFAAPGELDDTFGIAGRIQLQLGDPNTNPVLTELSAVAQQPDGKLVVAGAVQRNDLPNDFQHHFWIARLNADGSLDTTFDDDGWTSVGFAGGQSDDKAYALLVEPDGKIVLAGQTMATESGATDIALLRVNADGSPDTGFGTSGWAVLDAGGSFSERATGIVRRSDGGLVVAGVTDRNGDEDILFAAFDSTGQPDQGFGTDGVTLVGFGPNSSERATALVQQANGALVALGVGPGTSFEQTMVVVRLTAAGLPDASFDTDGLLVIDIPGSSYAEAASLALQSDGKIVVAGYAVVGSGYHPTLARLEASGALDTTFNGTGIVTKDLGANWVNQYVGGLAIQADGKLVIGGHLEVANFNRAQDLYLARLGADGATDDTFGFDGLAIADFGVPNDVSRVTGYAVLRQGDGRLVAAGRDTTGVADIARFDATGGGSGGVLSFLEPNLVTTEDAGTVSISVRRTGGATGAASTNVRIGDVDGYASAALGCDFSGVTTSLSWADGDTGLKQVGVTILDDSYQELNDVFELELFDATGAVLGTTNHLVAIQYDNNDTVPPTSGSASIEQAKTVGEAVGSVTLLVSRASGSQDCMIVSYRTYDGNTQFPATAGNDYVATSGFVQFDEGDTAAKQIVIPIVNDTVGEADEDFGVELTSATGSLGNSFASVTIQDDDGGFPGEIVIFGDGTDQESDGAAGGPITLSRQGGSNGAISVTYTLTSGTATAGSDFIATTGTVSWASGETADKQIFVQILEDTLEEASETYLVTLSNPTGGAILGEPAEWTQTILDNDTEYPGEISCTVHVNSTPAYEQPGSAFVYALRTNGRDGLVTVDYTTSSGTATAGADFTTTTGMLTWQDQSGCAPAPGFQCSGNPQQFITIPILDDALAEGDETFTVTLSNPTGGATLATNSTCTVTIYRNDSPNGTISYVDGSVDVSETAGTVTITMSRTGGTQGVVSLDFETLGSSATPGLDFTTTTGALTWSDGDGANKTITIPILDDVLLDANEFFYVLANNLSGGAIFDPRSCYSFFSETCYATVSIIDNENNAGTLVFPDTITVAENAGPALLNVSRTLGTSGAVSVAYATVPNTAQPPGDYATTSGTLSWAAGEGGFKTITMPITNDTVTEPLENFTVSFSNVTGGAALPETAATVEITDDDDPGDIALSLATVNVSETAATLNLTVARSTGVAGAVSVGYSTINGTATAASDYAAASGTLFWADGESGPKIIPITILDDAIEEADETFAVNLSAPTGGARLQQASTSVTIQDNDANPGQLRFAVSAASVSEAAATVQIDVERFGGSLGAVSIQYATAAGGALAGSDYTTMAGTLNWADGDKTTKSFSIPLVDDTVAEPDENFTVILSNPTGGAVLAIPSVETVTITNDDPPNGILALDPQFLTVTEGGQAVMQVTRTGGSGGAVQIDYATFDLTAAAPSDFTAATGTLTWANGDTAPKTIAIDTVDDAEDERPETFYVRLANIQGGAFTGVTETVVSITDNDVGPTGTLGVSAPALSIDESTSLAVVTVSRTGGFSGPVSVDYTTQDFTALAGSDYTAQGGTLNWADGDNDGKQISVAIDDDALDEPDEAFLVVLSGATGAPLDSNATTTTVTILDNDLPPVPGVLSVAGPASVNEATANVTFTVSRTAGSDGAVSVDYVTVAGTATADADYGTRSGTLNWASGDLVPKSVTVPIIDDVIDEPHETFALNLSNPGGGATLGTASAPMLIIDDDLSGPGALSIVANVQVFETVGNAIVSVQRTGGFDGAVGVGYTTTSDTAVDGQDFNAVSGTLNWADGDGGIREFQVPILNDALPEALESFVASLANPTGGATIGIGTRFVTIVDDDVPGTLAFAQTAALIPETSSPVSLTVSRTNGSKGAVSVNYATTAGSATAGSDYTTSAGTLDWADGDSSNRTIDVPILDDALVEADETFTVTLSGATGGAAIGAADTATVTIQSDEIPEPGTLRMVSAAVDVGEAAGTVVLSVERVGGSDGAVGIDFGTVTGTATAADFTPTSGTLDWADGDTANKTITVPITDDTLFETDEAFAVNLSNPQGGAILSNPSTTVTIQSDDAAVPGTLAFQTTALSVNETGGTAQLSVTRTDGSDGAVSVSFATAFGTATVADFTAASGTLNWANGDSATKSFNVTITNDSLFEPDEVFTASLANVTGGAALGADTATVTIVSEDLPQRGTLAMANAAVTVDETAGTVTLTVNRTGGSDGAVGVGWETAPGTATVADFGPDAGTLNWADGDAAPKTFTVAITDDTLFEPDEVFTAMLSNATGGAAIGADTTAVTIQSNEAPVSGTIRMAATAASVDETAGTIVLSVERIGGSDNAVGVSFASATETAGAGDFTATSGTLSWANGESTAKTITVPITNDTAFEPDETFTVNLSNVTGGAALGTPTTTVTIVSEDPPQRGTLAMAAATASVIENLGSVSIPVSRSGGADGAVSVDYATATGTGGAADFTSASGTLSWADGDSAPKSIVIAVTNDTLFEPDETFTVNLSNATGGAALGAATTTVTIVSEDAPQRGTLAMASGAATVNETAGTVTISVTRSGGTDGAVGVSYATTAGTASAADFLAASGTLTWADGDSGTKSFDVGVTNDAVVENDEVFAVTLSNPTGGAALGTASTTVTITDDDILVVPGTLGLTQAAVTVSETAGTAVLTVTRSNGLGGAVSVDYSAVGGSAEAGEDFAAAAGTLSWAGGEGGSKSITITLLDDTLVESDETFTVRLENAQGGAGIGLASATVTVQSEDVPPDTTPDAFSFNDQSGLPLNAEVTSNEIVVGGINAPAGIDITGGEYSVDGEAFTDEPGTVANGARVRVRVVASNAYTTTVSATLTIGGVSDTFSVTTKSEDVVTVVRGKSGGGSFGAFGTLLLGAMWAVRRRRPATLPVGLLLATLTLSSATQAAEGGLYVGAGGGTGNVNVDAGQVGRRLEFATGEPVTDVRLDENGTSYHLRIGYEFNRYAALEAAYYDFGILEARVTAEVPDPGLFARELARAFPSNMHGPAVQVVAGWPFMELWVVRLGVGAMEWRTDVAAKILSGGSGTFHADHSGTDLIWSARLGYLPTDRIAVTLEYTQVQTRDTVSAVQLGVAWRTGWLSR